MILSRTPHGRLRSALLAGALVIVDLEGTSAQTFVQLTDLGSSIGPRLTRAVTRAQLGRALFGVIGTKVTYINHGTVYQLASDPEWSRVLVGQKDVWIHEYDNTGGPGGVLQSPTGIDISARRWVYVADGGARRILVARFDPGVENLTNPSSLGSFLVRAVDVAWDGQTSPLTNDFVYILDDSLNEVSYWDFNAGQLRIWNYGSRGGGVGQFLRPTGVCVGKAAAPNGGTQFTTYFYVVDRGNHRVVWLNRASTAPTWLSAISVPGWSPTN